MNLLERLEKMDREAPAEPWFWMDPSNKERSDIGYYETYDDGSSGPGSKFAVIMRDSGVYPPDVSTGDLIIEMRNSIKKLRAVVEAGEHMRKTYWDFYSWKFAHIMGSDDDIEVFNSETEAMCSAIKAWDKAKAEL